ncbi:MULTISPECIES: 50S ribosomal protein L11 methyltransferase [Chelativorans]|jgi:ribosomal protein L11 methyltransferase|uniref:Ribosomal protein L11 methyltransferase n=1 Tax=Chelativorans sp. (strain BNC1) TaxID=266779 RepID=PRMA_CHESB|nr:MULTISPECIES: 50S ribosomal protein L11 methyltransferase [Chelativorans]Q11GT9.1 RecName: Full=Ribosomal protein L11 methyltransferase; Short=L11 Mtase [Chelativorans sp. BNC1]
MPQTRLFFRSNGAPAREAFSRLEAAFEEDGLPLAIRELDEERDIHEVSIYASEDWEGVADRMRSCLTSIAGLSEIETEELPEIDWVAHSLAGLKAVRAGRFFVHGSHERGQHRAGEIPIEIEASLAFGTGHHGTTSGCLEMISRVVPREHPRNALDLGTGSAVLAIAIARLAHIPVLATDIDPVAVRVARENVRLNRAAEWVETAAAPGFHHPAFARRMPFDLIVANILARPLIGLAPAMARHLSPGGSLILSGILTHQRRQVIAGYVGQGFRHLTTLHREEWVTIHMKR